MPGMGAGSDLDARFFTFKGIHDRARYYKLLYTILCDFMKAVSSSG